MPGIRIRGTLSIFLNGEWLLLGECMSSSAGSFIGFGYAFDEFMAFPWDAEPFKGDVEAWWRSVNGFKDQHEPYDENGDHREGFTVNDPRIGEMYEARGEWHKLNPMPVDVKQFGQLDAFDDEKQFAIVVRGIGCDCLDADDPERFDPSTESFKLLPHHQFQLAGFLNKYGIGTDQQQSWMLCCYY